MDFTGKAALTAYGCAAASLFILDIAWLRVVMGPMYRVELGEMIRAQPSLAPSLVFYLLYAIGVVVFAIVPGVDATSMSRAGFLGALLGLVAFATYDLSNLANLKGWPLDLAMLDIAWGTFLTAAAAASATAAVIAVSHETSVLR